MLAIGTVTVLLFSPKIAAHFAVALTSLNVPPTIAPNAASTWFLRTYIMEKVGEIRQVSFTKAEAGPPGSGRERESPHYSYCILFI